MIRCSFRTWSEKPLAITPPSFFFHHRGTAFGSSKAVHCLLLISCLLLSSVNTLHNLAEYGPCGSNGYNTFEAKGIQGFDGEDSEGLAIQNSDQNVCPSSQLFSFLSALGSENQSYPTVPFFGLSCPNELQSSSALLRDNLCGVVWLSLKPVHIIEFQPFSVYCHIGDATCYNPLWKELYAMKNTRDISIAVMGKQCEGNGYVVNNQCEGLSSEPEGSVKFLFFYQTEHDSWTSGDAVFSVPMKATAPVLMLNLNKKPVFWVRTKKILIALLIAASLVILIFCFNDHFIDESNKGTSCSNHMELRKVEKSSMITISPEMDSLLRAISGESLHGFDEVPKSSNVKPIASVSSPISSNGEASEAVNLTVKTAKDKKRRRNKKKKGGLLTSELTDVSSSHSGNSTPRSPLPPKPPTTEATTKSVKLPKPVSSHSATIPISEVKSMEVIQQSFLAPNVIAPGAKSITRVKEEKAKEYRYDIWGDHLTGLHLMDRFKDMKEGKSSSFDGDESKSFFVKGPQNLLADSHVMFVSFCNQWG